MRTANRRRMATCAAQSAIALVIVASAGLVGIRYWGGAVAAERVSLAGSAVSGEREGSSSATAPSPVIDAAAKAWLIAFAGRDPSGLLHLARERCPGETSSYRCLFVKQERIDGILKPVEEIDARYRADPLSVFMTWRCGADQATRALFIDNRDFVEAVESLAGISQSASASGVDYRI